MLEEVGPILLRLEGKDDIYPAFQVMRRDIQQGERRSLSRKDK